MNGTANRQRHTAELRTQWNEVGKNRHVGCLSLFFLFLFFSSKIFFWSFAAVCCIPVWVGREEREYFICERKSVRLKRGKKQRKYRYSGIKTKEQWESCRHAATVLIAVSSTVVDFSHYHSSWLAPSSVQMSGDPFFATWATYFSLWREKLVLCSICPDTACFVCFPQSFFFPGNCLCAHFPKNKDELQAKVVCSAQGLMFRHSLCMRTQIADGLNKLELCSSNKAHLIINLLS